MSNMSNRALHSIFGCPNASETYQIDAIGASGHQTLEQNEIYRFTCTTDCYISIDTALGELGSASGVRLFPSIPEMFATTGSNVYLNTLQDENAGTGKITVTKMLTRGV